MIADIFTIIWKEWKEIFLQRGNVRSGLINLAVILGIIGVFFPLQSGTKWLSDPTGLVTWLWLPLFLVMGVVTDAIAGERERHTLETLLASRLPDRAILIGKIGAAVLYGWSMVWVSMLLGAVTVNISSPAGGLKFYSLDLFITGLVLSLLANLLIGSIGVLVSLHSPTARQAYQRMSLVFLVLWFSPVIILQFLPQDIRRSLFQIFSALNGRQLLFGVLIFLVVFDAALIKIAIDRFQRSRLILD
jgi:ABC-2 type transport system permease protein